MPPVFRSALLFLLSLPAFVLGAGSLDHAAKARAMIGEETWSRVIEVENTSGNGFYPKRFHALVFELGGILWFYADAEGTQSFSLHKNNLAREKADFAPLLRAIDPGFVAHRILTEDELSRVAAAGVKSIPNGCFVESYASLRGRMDGGELILNARLMSVYPRGRRSGHTVLTYETPSGMFVLDPDGTGEPVSVKRRHAKDPLAIARRLFPGVAIDRARWVPTLSTINTELFAALDARCKPVDSTTALQ